MNKKLYYILTTIAFGFISIPTVLSIIFQEEILIDSIDRNVIKTILVLFICVTETFYIRKTTARIFSWSSVFILYIGSLFKIMHWPWSRDITKISGLATLAILCAFAIIEKNKNVFHYLLFVFVFEHILTISTDPNKVLWWFDIIICSVITIVGIGYIYRSNTTSIIKE
jgi:hypothetical protein